VAHPFAYVFDNETATADGMPGWYAPYLARAPFEQTNAIDYADPEARLTNTRTSEFRHPNSDIPMALTEAGLTIECFEEHDAIAWQMSANLVQDEHGLYRWPERPWLPLSYTIRARRL
jgi:hypothetical protein